MNYNDPQTYLQIIKRKGEKRREWNNKCNGLRLLKREMEKELDKVLRGGKPIQ